eukprot:NODE_439_length_8587_cov_0.367224.p4 type:complete len:309 gc:universal NODE_439_length_8587_cov_0.367224:3761-4687(+)
MAAFGHTTEEIQKAFESDQSQNRPNPIRSTYFLLQEMMEKERRKSSAGQSQGTLSNEERKSTTLFAITEDKPLSPNNNIENAKNNFPSMPQVTPERDRGRRASAFDTRTPQPDRQRNSTADGTKQQVTVSSQNLSPTNGPKSAPVQSVNTLQVPTSEDKGRRHSETTIESDTSDRSLNDGSDPAIKSLTSWFLNNQTTSNKQPAEIIGEAVRVLKENGIHYAIDGYSIECVQDEKLTEQEFQSYQSKDIRRGSIMAIPPQMSKNAVVFRIEVGKVPKISMHGITFKRISGGVWNYKKICNKIVQQMNL